MIRLDLARQVSSFGVVGVAATIVHVSLALSLNSLIGVGPIAANFAGYMAAFAVSYLGNSVVTFRRPALSGERLSRFLIVSLGGLALNQAIVFPLVKLAHLPLKLALVPAVLAVAAASFTASRLWVFSRGEPGAGQSSTS